MILVPYNVLIPTGMLCSYFQETYPRTFYKRYWEEIIQTVSRTAQAMPGLKVQPLECDMTYVEPHIVSEHHGKFQWDLFKVESLFSMWKDRHDM